MTAVIDVSGAAQILFQTSKKDRFETVLQNASRVLSPDLYRAELSNTLWKYYIKGIYTQEECVKIIEDGLNYVDEYISSKNIWREAFGESVKNKHSVYDMLYAVIARENNAVLMTNDKALVKICEKLNVEHCF
jgi:predicted nucleic acid-binding protein